MISREVAMISTIGFYSKGYAAAMAMQNKTIHKKRL
jgi:hypothetical protein